VSILAGDKLKEKIEEFIPGNRDPQQLAEERGWLYDLRLGEEYYITTDDAPRKLSESEPYLIIKPGDFALLTTHEYVKIPDEYMAFISIRFSYKQKGLINISGFHVDPGFEGIIIFSVYNAGPSEIVLKYLEPVFMIFFSELSDRGCDKPREPQVGIPLHMVAAIRGRSVSLTTQASRIDRLEFMLKLYGAIALGLFLSLFSWLLRGGVR